MKCTEHNKEYFGGREESRTPKALLTLGGFQDRFRHQSICSSMILEHRVRFELTVLEFCRLLHWASLPPVHIVGVGGAIRTPIMQFWRLPFCQLELHLHKKKNSCDKFITQRQEPCYLERITRLELVTFTLAK
jgi:hypothetical protein